MLSINRKINKGSKGRKKKEKTNEMNYELVKLFAKRRQLTAVRGNNVISTEIWSVSRSAYNLW